jgi:hypothetical protein
MGCAPQEIIGFKLTVAVLNTLLQYLYITEELQADLGANCRAVGSIVIRPRRDGFCGRGRRRDFN